MFPVKFVFLVSFTLTRAATNYCGSLTSSTAQGVTGYLSMTVGDGIALYNVNLDLSKWENTTYCDLNKGISYHLHTKWTSATSNSNYGSLCGKDYLGGHYDPNFACSNFSEAASSYCPGLNRTVSTGYTYTCNPSVYTEGNYFKCEVGDISGKFGILYSQGKNIFGSSGKFVQDNQPPYAASYAQTSHPLFLGWSSVIFHCNADNARLFCAKMITVQAGESSTCPFISTECASCDDSYKASSRDYAIAMSVFVALFVVTFGILVYVKCMAGVGQSRDGLLNVVNRS